MTGQDHVTLWSPIGQAERDLLAASGWKAWPSRPVSVSPDRAHAVRISREHYAAAEGAGFVMSFDVAPAFLDREGEDINAHLTSAIMEDAAYLGPVGDQEFLDAEAALGRPLPTAWRDYLQGPSWLRAGWLRSGAYVCLNTPHEMLGLHEAWGVATVAHPGIAIIGGDGSRDQLVLDLRADPAPVLLTDITSAGWDSAFRQADHVGELITRIESGDYMFACGDD